MTLDFCQKMFVPTALMLAVGLLCASEGGENPGYAGGFIAENASVLPETSEWKSIAKFLDKGGSIQRLNKLNTVSYHASLANTLFIIE